MERRVEQADGHRQARHDLEQLDEIAALHRQQLGERAAPALLVVGQDHLAHRQDASLLEEHMLGAGQADAFGAKGTGLLGVGRGVGIGADFQAAKFIGPGHQSVEVVGQLRLARLDAAFDDLTGRAVDGDEVAFVQRHAAGLKRLALEIDLHGGRTGNARPPHAARDDRSVAGHAAARGDNARGGVHALHVFGRGLDPRQHHGVPMRLHMHGLVGIEDELAGRGARRGRKAGGDHHLLGGGIKCRMQQLIELVCVDAHHRLFAC